MICHNTVSALYFMFVYNYSGMHVPCRSGVDVYLNIMKAIKYHN